MLLGLYSERDAVVPAAVIPVFARIIMPAIVKLQNKPCIKGGSWLGKSYNCIVLSSVVGSVSR
jgi:hypothetical protein